MTAGAVRRSPEIVIEAPSRWDAVDLARRLPACRWFMVERDHAHWDVHVRLDDAPLRLAAEVEGVAEEWARRRLSAARG